MPEKYLLDANIFITPYELYYPFDFARGFWDQLKERLRLDNVTVLDVVVAETTRLENELSEWINDIEDLAIVSVKNSAIISNYGKVLTYIQQSGLYKEEALRVWAGGSVADPWLIAVAMDIDAIIITTEVSAGTGLSPKNPSRNAKLPDVARHFGVRCENLFYFMRQTGFKL